LGAGGTHAGFELVEEAGVVVVDGIDEAGNEDIGLGVGFGKEAADEVRGALFFEIAGGEAGRVEERAIHLFALEKAFAEEAVESGHDRGVGEGGVDVFGDLLDGGAAQLAENGQHFALATTEEGAGWCRGGAVPKLD
jgi:hypothetical protein